MSWAPASPLRRGPQASPGRIKEFCGRIIVLSHFKKTEKAGFFLVELVCAVIDARDNAPTIRSPQKQEMPARRHAGKKSFCFVKYRFHLDDHLRTQFLS